MEIATEVRQVRGVCPHDCPDTCGLITEVEGGRARHVRGDPDHPVTDGWLCAKVSPYLDHVYHPDRLQYPMRRIGPKGGGRWERMSWDEAVREIGDRWRGIIERYGAAAIMPYSYSGTLGLVQMVVSSSRFWNRLGACRTIRSICGAAAERAVEVTLGGRFGAPYSHVTSSKLVIIWGHNPVSTAPHFMPWLRQAQRQGALIVVIDPIRTRTAQSADRHIAIRPGADGALALGMAHVIVDEGLHDEAWLDAHTVGWPGLRDRLRDYPPDRVASVTGIPESDVVWLARAYATTKPSMVKFCDGLQRRVNGGQTIRTLAALPALTGQYGVRGGGLAYSTSSYYAWNQEALHHTSECPPPARSINMNRLGAALTGEATDPPIQSLYVFGANPAAISPNAGLIVEGLKRDDLFTVVHELYLTDTARYADIVLPATSQLEQDDLNRGYGHMFVMYNQRAIDPIGESKSNWDVMRLLAREMGLDEPWLQQSVDEVIDEALTATVAENAAFAGITLARLKAEGRAALSLPYADDVPFANGQFPTRSGKVELWSAELEAEGSDPLPGWGEDVDAAAPPDHVNRDDRLRLLTPAGHHFVSSTFANDARLERLEGGPFIELHPDDASARGIRHGDLVLVENRRGSCRLRAVVRDRVPRGVAASPKGFWSMRSASSNGAAAADPRNINWTTNDALADYAGQSTFHTNDVWVSRVDQ